MFLLDFINAFQIWAKFHDTHILSTDLQFLPKIDVYTLSDNSDCMLYGSDFSKFFICPCSSTPGTAQCTFFLDIVNALQSWAKFHGTHFLTLNL